MFLCSAMPPVSRCTGMWEGREAQTKDLLPHAPFLLLPVASVIPFPMFGRRPAGLLNGRRVSHIR